MVKVGLIHRGLPQVSQNSAAAHRRAVGSPSREIRSAPCPLRK